MNCAIDMSLLESCEPTAPIGAAELTLISKWLDDFEADAGKCLAIDAGYRLWADYEQFGGQNRASLVLLKKLDSCLTVRITAPARSLPAVGSAWAHLDPHRTWLLAGSLAQVAVISIVNATHIEWEATRLPNTSPRPSIIQLLSAWITERVRGLTPPEFMGPCQPPPHRLSGSLAAAEPKGCGQNGRKAWENATHRFEWDYQHGTVEVYLLSSGVWVHEARPDGTIIKTTGGNGRVWGR